MSQTRQFVERTTDGFVDQIAAALPRIIWAVVFLFVAYIVVSVVTSLVRRSLERWYGTEQQLVADLGVTLASVFLWFGVALALLKILGMGDIAAGLGTASGFIALGVSYALSDMIEDTVSGIYLLRDPDFNVGDRIITDKVTGTVAAIELRKSRIETDDGDRVIIANRDIEARWTHDLPGDGDDVETDAENADTGTEDAGA